MADVKYLSIISDFDIGPVIHRVPKHHSTQKSWALKHNYERCQTVMAYIDQQALPVLVLDGGAGDGVAERFLITVCKKVLDNPSLNSVYLHCK